MTHYFDEQIRQWEKTIDNLLVNMHKWVRHNLGVLPLSEYSHVMQSDSFITEFNKMIETLREAEKKYPKIKPGQMVPVLVKPPKHLCDYYAEDIYPPLVEKMERRINQLQQYQDAVLAARDAADDHP